MPSLSLSPPCALSISRSLDISAPTVMYLIRASMQQIINPFTFFIASCWWTALPLSLLSFAIAVDFCCYCCCRSMFMLLLLPLVTCTGHINSIECIKIRMRKWYNRQSITNARNALIAYARCVRSNTRRVRFMLFYDRNRCRWRLWRCCCAVAPLTIISNTVQLLYYSILWILVYKTNSPTTRKSWCKNKQNINRPNNNNSNSNGNGNGQQM